MILRQICGSLAGDEHGEDETPSCRVGASGRSLDGNYIVKTGETQTQTEQCLLKANQRIVWKMRFISAETPRCARQRRAGRTGLVERIGWRCWAGSRAVELCGWVGAREEGSRTCTERAWTRVPARPEVAGRAIRRRAR